MYEAHLVLPASGICRRQPPVDRFPALLRENLGASLTVRANFKFVYYLRGAGSISGAPGNEYLETDNSGCLLHCTPFVGACVTLRPLSMCFCYMLLNA